MPCYLYDGLERSYQDDYYYFRLGEFKHLYYCSSCTRSFDSKENTNVCKFCSSNLEKSMLNNKEDSKLIELKFDEPVKMLSDSKLAKIKKDMNIKEMHNGIIKLFKDLSSRAKSF